MKMNRSDSITERWTITSIPRRVMPRWTYWSLSVASMQDSRPPILNPDRDFGTLPDQLLERRHTYWISQSLTEPGGGVGQRRRRWWRAWRNARTVDWQTSRNLGCATADHEFLCLCHGNLP